METEYTKRYEVLENTCYELSPNLLIGTFRVDLLKDITAEVLKTIDIKFIYS